MYKNALQLFKKRGAITEIAPQASYSTSSDHELQMKKQQMGIQTGTLTDNPGMVSEITLNYLGLSLPGNRRGRERSEIVLAMYSSFLFAQPLENLGMTRSASPKSLAVFRFRVIN